MGMDCGEVDPEIRSKFVAELKHLPPGMCFVRCEYISRTDALLRCWVPMPERRVGFDVHHSVLKDDRGDAVPSGRIARIGTVGWARAEIASPERDGSVVVRLRLFLGDEVELDVDPRCVVSG